MARKEVIIILRERTMMSSWYFNHITNIGARGTNVRHMMSSLPVMLFYRIKWTFILSCNFSENTVTSLDHFTPTEVRIICSPQLLKTMSAATQRWKTERNDLFDMMSRICRRRRYIPLKWNNSNISPIYSTSIRHRCNSIAFRGWRWGLGKWHGPGCWNEDAKVENKRRGCIVHTPPPKSGAFRYETNSEAS